MVIHKVTPAAAVRLHHAHVGRALFAQLGQLVVRSTPQAFADLGDEGRHMPHRRQPEHGVARVGCAVCMLCGVHAVCWCMLCGVRWAVCGAVAGCTLRGSSSASIPPARLGRWGWGVSCSMHPWSRGGRTGSWCRGGARSAVRTLVLARWCRRAPRCWQSGRAVLVLTGLGLGIGLGLGLG